MGPESPKTQLLLQIAEWEARSLVIEFKCGFSLISGLCTLREASTTRLRFRLAVPMCANCELEISLAVTPLSFSVTSFEEALQGILKPAIEDLASEGGHSLSADIVERVAEVHLAQGATLLIGPLRENVESTMPSPTPPN